MTHTQKDWHPADIIAALSRESGLSSSTLANTLSRPWPKGEILIATRLGVDPSEIWPSRYFDHNGQLIKRLMRKRISG